MGLKHKMIFVKKFPKYPLILQYAETEFSKVKKLVMMVCWTEKAVLMIVLESLKGMTAFKLKLRSPQLAVP